MKTFIYLFLSLLPLNTLFAQQFGGTPPSLKWQQINTPQVKIIFPMGLDTPAMEIASITEKLYAQQPSSIGNKLRKVNIVLQNQTLKTNGYVGLGPYRSEFFLAPSPNSFELGSLPWHQTLAIHEFRHVQQFSNFNKGWSKVFSILFGEQGQAVANNVAVPNWFWEGDAVANETQVSDQGRGRLPFFFNGYTSLLKEKRQYSRMKLRNGSLQDYVPDHYKMGYLLVAYGRQQYGTDFWKNVTQDAVRFKGLFYPLQRAIKKYTGINYGQYQENAFHYFDSVNVQLREVSNRASQLLQQSTQHNHFQADYEYPYIIGKDSVLVLKKNYHSIPTFYIMDSMGEHRLRTMNIHVDDYYSYRNGKIIYTSYKPDVRWGWRDQTRITVLDIASNKQKYIIHNGKYFSPDMDESGKYIIAVAVNNKGESELHCINLHTSEIKSIPNLNRLFFTYPKFVDSSTVVSTARTQEGKMTLVQIRLKDGAIQYLTPATFRVMGFPCVTDNYIYFSASTTLSDEQFAVDRKNGNIFQITKDNISSYQPTVKNNVMIRTVFTATGYHLLTNVLDSSVYQIMDSVQWANINSNLFYPSITINQKNVLNAINEKKNNYTIQPYIKSTGLFNFHSWRPFYKNPVYSFTIYGENILNTFQSELAYAYNENEVSHTASYNLIYGGLFPYIRTGINYTFNRSVMYGSQLLQWNELEVTAGLLFPFNLTDGRHYTNLMLGSNYTITKPSFKGVAKGVYDDKVFTYLNTMLSFSRQTQLAVQHIYPRFAQSCTFNMRNAVINRNAYQWAVTGNLYFPGLFKNHSLALEGAYQEHDREENLSFSNSFPFSRGYSVFNFQNMQKLSVNYHVPLSYPDVGVAGILYLMRVRANIFYDYSRIVDSRLTQSFSFKSTGAELFLDTKWWNQFPVTIGVRYSRLLDRDFRGNASNQWEIILPTNLF